MCSRPHSYISWRWNLELCFMTVDVELLSIIQCKLLFNKDLFSHFFQEVRAREKWGIMIQWVCSVGHLEHFISLPRNMSLLSKYMWIEVFTVLSICWINVIKVYNYSHNFINIDIDTLILFLFDKCMKFCVFGFTLWVPIISLCL